MLDRKKLEAIADKIIAGKGYKLHELEAAGVDFKKGWRKKALKELGARSKVKTEGSVEVPIEKGFMFRNRGKYHIVANHMALCRRQDFGKQTYSDEPPNLTLCKICRHLQEVDPQNIRATNAERRASEYAELEHLAETRHLH